MPYAAISLEDAYRAITDPELYKKQTENFRETIKQGDGIQAKEQKNRSFDYVTFSGDFKYIANKDIVNHSGLLCVDIDHIKDADLKSKLLQDPIIDTFLLFTSPSGDGLK